MSGIVSRMGQLTIKQRAVLVAAIETKTVGHDHFRPYGSERLAAHRLSEMGLIEWLPNGTIRATDKGNAVRSKS